MTRRERMEARKVRRLEWATRRDRKAEAGFSRAHSIADAIPLGQPILVGHHSEAHARKDQERIHSGMSQGCESQAMAEHHRSKADGIQQQLNHSIFSDDPDATERIEDRIAHLEAKREARKAVNKIVHGAPKDQWTPAKETALMALGLTQPQAEKLFQPDFAGRVGFPAYSLTNLGANIRRLKERLVSIDRQAKRTEAAEAAGGVVIAGDEFINVTFAEKPERRIIEELKSAGFCWGGGCWGGYRARLPESVVRMVEDLKPEAEQVTP